MIKIAILGLGRAGGFHLQSLRLTAHASVAAVYDCNAERSRQVAQEHDCTAANSAEEAIETADAVIVSTPTDTHEPYVRMALEAGKPVLTEKPLARELDDIDRCFELAKSKSLPLFVAFQRRFDPSFQSLIKAVHAGRIGRLEFLRSVSRDNPVPSVEYLKISGGIYHDCGVHDLDMVCHLAQAWPTEVSAFGTSLIPQIGELDDHDNLVANLIFPSGLVASIDVNRHCAFGYDQRVEAFGNDGMLIAENQHRNLITEANQVGFTRSPIEYSFPTRYEQAYRAEIEAFLACVRGEQSVPITHQDVRMNHRLASALESSARTKRVVTIA